jgi:hypothetical protein
MTDAVPCRLCNHPVLKDARTCPSCGTKDPWIPDEPEWNPRVIRFVAWGGGVALFLVLLLLSGIVMFAPREDERDHARATEPDTHELR